MLSQGWLLVISSPLGPHHKYGTDRTEGATPMLFQCCIEDPDVQPGLELSS